MQVNEERLLGYLIELLKIRSHSFHEREIVDYLLLKIDELGFDCYEDSSSVKTGSNAGNVIVNPMSGVKGTKLVFCTHMDTIDIGLVNEINFKDRTIFSNHICPLGIDDKAGIAVVLEVLSILAESGRLLNRVSFIFTTCEEEGFRGAHSIDGKLLKGCNIFVLDSGGAPIGRIVNQAVGQTSFYITIFGKESHTGSFNGISAIFLASQFISKLSIGKINDDITVNISKLQSGGSTNTVPCNAMIKGEILWSSKNELNKEIEKIKKALDWMAESFRGEYLLKMTHDCKPFNILEEAEIMRMAKEAAKKCALKFDTGKTGAGSDAQVFNQRGFCSVKVSNGMKNVHTREEQICLDDLNDCVRFVLSMIECN